jgi:hypothetical protein
VALRPVLGEGNAKGAEMSRSGYSEDCDGWDLIRWRGAVTSAIRGKRGQALLLELRDALDAMPEKGLIAHELVDASGAFCTLGVIGSARGLPLSEIDPEDSDQVAKWFDIAPALAKEIVFENDEACWRDETPQQRWDRMRQWVELAIKTGEQS